VFARILVKKVIGVLATYRSEAFLQMIQALTDARTINTVDGLQMLDDFHNLWSPSRQLFIIDHHLAQTLQFNINHDTVLRPGRWQLKSGDRPPVRIPRHMQKGRGPSLRYMYTWRMVDEMHARHPSLVQIHALPGVLSDGSESDADSESETHSDLDLESMPLD